MQVPSASDSCLLRGARQVLGGHGAWTPGSGVGRPPKVAAIIHCTYGALCALQGLGAPDVLQLCSRCAPGVNVAVQLRPSCGGGRRRRKAHTAATTVDPGHLVSNATSITYVPARPLLNTCRSREI